MRLARVALLVVVALVGAVCATSASERLAQALNAAQPTTAERARLRIIARYRTLPSGPVEQGPPGFLGPAGAWNDVYSVFTVDHDRYTSSAWQGRVLRMLDGMRTGAPEDRAALEHFDYGPIEAYYGGHQAVVIYPRGSDWRQSGTVLDPWPNQRPDTFSITEWSDRFWFGVGPSTVYAGLYPLTGAAAYPASGPTLPEAQPAPADATAAVLVQSPVRLLVTDALGRRVGWADEVSFVYEIPGTDIDLFPEADGGYGMVVLLPLAAYDVRVTGDSPGSFSFVRALPTTVAAYPLASARGVPIVPGEQFSFRLSADAADAPLQGSDGTVHMLEAMDVTVLTGGVSLPPTTPTVSEPPAEVTIPSTPPAAVTTTTTIGVPPASGALADGVAITAPVEGEHIQGRVEVRGTGKPGALIVVSTEVHAQANDELLRDVPGSRARIGEDGAWQVWVAAPVLPENVAQPLYYILKAHWITADGQQSGEARVKLYRAE